MSRSYDALPQRWPSAWRSMRSQVLLSLVFPIVLLVVLTVILMMTKVLGIVWWILVVPTLLIIWAISLPGRVRSVVQSDAAAGRLRVMTGQTGLLAESPKRRRGVRPHAQLSSDASGQEYIQYFVS